MKNIKTLSPSLFYRDGKFENIQKTVVQNNITIVKGERRKIIEIYLSIDNLIILGLKTIHIFGELLDYNYFIQKDFSQLFKKMEEIKSQKKYIIKEEKSQSSCELFDKIEKFREVDKEKLADYYDKKLEKEGIIRIGDVHYTKEEFTKIIENVNKNLKNIQKK